MIQKQILSATLAVSAIFVSHLPTVWAADSNLKCAEQAVISYRPGPNWQKLEQALPAHLNFIDSLIKSAKFVAGGPFIGADGQPSGAQMILNTKDLREAAAIASNDPLVTNKVSFAQIQLWLMCR